MGEVGKLEFGEHVREETPPSILESRVNRNEADSRIQEPQGSFSAPHIGGTQKLDWT